MAVHLKNGARYRKSAMKGGNVSDSVKPRETNVVAAKRN